MGLNRSDTASLITLSYTQSDYGVYTSSESSLSVYVDVTSVNSKEWYEGARNGLNPQYRFTMFSFDYDGQKIIEYNGTRYTVYRTFLKSKDEIELYTELNKGNE